MKKPVRAIKPAPQAKGPQGSPWPADHVERRSVASLVPYARNSRVHSKAQVRKIAASIREFGWTIPVLIDEAGQIIAGHGRVMAAQLLEILEIPVMVAIGWSDHQRRAYVIADNKLTLEGEWDDVTLRIELKDLAESDFDVSLTGFDGKELADIINADLSGDDDEGGEADAGGEEEGDAVLCLCPECGHQFKATLVATKPAKKRRARKGGKVARGADQEDDHGTRH